MTAGSPDVREAATVRRGVSATVRTTDGWPVPGAVLTVTDGAGAQVARVPADEQGRLATEPLRPAVYTAIVTAAGYSPLARTAIVTASGSALLGSLELARVGGGEDLPEAGVWTLDPAHTMITITARHLGLASVRGRFTEFDGAIEVGRPVERSTVTARIRAASIDTGNTMRDDHLRSPDFLNVDVHPLIEYRGTGVVPLGGEKWRLDGELTLNAITRAVPMELSYVGVGPDPWGGTRAAFRAVTDLKREDFAITYNQIVRAGIGMIGTTLRVEIDVEAVRGEVLPTG